MGKGGKEEPKRSKFDTAKLLLRSIYDNQSDEEFDSRMFVQNMQSQEPRTFVYSTCLMAEFVKSGLASKTSGRNVKLTSTINPELTSTQLKTLATK